MTEVLNYLVGPLPSIDTPEGPYPTIVDHGSRKTLVVQSYFAAKYLGFLNITFDSSNNVESWKGQPILLDNNTLQGTDRNPVTIYTSIIIHVHEITNFLSRNNRN